MRVTGESVVFIALWAGAAFARAAAPESIAGKVYHELGGIPSVRAKWESIVSLGADGRYAFLKRASGSFVSNPIIGLDVPPEDGDYTYVRTGEFSARLTLRDRSGSLISGIAPQRTNSLTIELSFDDASRGSWSASGGTGAFYFTDTAAPPVANISLRATVAPNRATIAGFVVPGSPIGARRRTDLLIRVIGPSLSQFGVANAWVDPDFTLALPPSSTFAQMRDWSAESPAGVAVRKLAAFVGAFPLLANSKDAVAVVSLYPGAYTIQCVTGAGDPGGEVLIEVYTLP